MVTNLLGVLVGLHLSKGALSGGNHRDRVEFFFDLCGRYCCDRVEFFFFAA